MARPGLDVFGHDLIVPAILLSYPPQQVQNGQPPKHLAPDTALHHDDFHVEPPEPAIGRTHKLSRPAEPRFVHARAPEEEKSDNTTAPAKLFDGFDHPIYTAAHAATVFTRAEEQQVSEDGAPTGEQD